MLPQIKDLRLVSTGVSDASRRRIELIDMVSLPMANSNNGEFNMVNEHADERDPAAGCDGIEAGPLGHADLERVNPT
jgi:hypothetical protein